MCQKNQRPSLNEAACPAPRVVFLVVTADRDGCTLHYFPEPRRLDAESAEIIKGGGRIHSIQDVRHFGHLHTHELAGRAVIESDYELYGGGGEFLSVESTEAFGCGYIDSDTDLNALMARLKKGCHLSIFEGVQ